MKLENITPVATVNFLTTVVDSLHLLMDLIVFAVVVGIVIPLHVGGEPATWWDAVYIGWVFFLGIHLYISKKLHSSFWHRWYDRKTAKFWVRLLFRTKICVSVGTIDPEEAAERGVLINSDLLKIAPHAFCAAANFKTYQLEVRFFRKTDAMRFKLIWG